MKIVSVLFVSFLLAACSSSNDLPLSETETETETETLEVYISDGAVQCESTGRAPADTAQTLIDNGIDVIESTCGYITGLAVAAQCGLGDTNINIHSISNQNLSDAVELGFENTASLAEGYTETCEWE